MRICFSLVSSFCNCYDRYVVTSSSPGFRVTLRFLPRAAPTLKFRVDSSSLIIVYGNGDCTAVSAVL